MAGGMSRVGVALIVVALVLAACAPAAQVIERRDPAAACDLRIVDLNRRLCAEKGRLFLEPGPAMPCGGCATR